MFDISNRRTHFFCMTKEKLLLKEIFQDYGAKSQGSVRKHLNISLFVFQTPRGKYGFDKNIVNFTRVVSRTNILSILNQVLCLVVLYILLEWISTESYYALQRKYVRFYSFPQLKCILNIHECINNFKKKPFRCSIRKKVYSVMYKVMVANFIMYIQDGLLHNSNKTYTYQKLLLFE